MKNQLECSKEEMMRGVGAGEGEGQRALRQVNRKKEKLTLFFFNAALSSLTSAEKRCQVPSDSQTVVAPRAPTYAVAGVRGRGCKGCHGCCHIYPKQW